MLSGLMISNWPMPILREGWGVETAANLGQLLVEARQHRIEHEKGMPIRRSTGGLATISSLRAMRRPCAATETDSLGNRQPDAVRDVAGEESAARRDRSQ